MNFKFKRERIGKTLVTISGMQIGAIVASSDSSYYKIFLAIDSLSTWKWSVLKKTFKQDSDARRFLDSYIDEILLHFQLYPITK
jgi:hypothetical protein